MDIYGVPIMLGDKSISLKKSNCFVILYVVIGLGQYLLRYGLGRQKRNKPEATGR